MKIKAFKINDISNPIIKQMGFEYGSILREKEPAYETVCDDNWLHFFNARYSNETGKIIFNDDSEQVDYTIHAWIDTRDGADYLWFEVMYADSYHAEMGELLDLMRIMHEFTKAGILEAVIEEGTHE